MRVGQSIWAREEVHLHDRAGSLLFTAPRSKEFVRHHSNPALVDSFDDDHSVYEQDSTLPQTNSISSSKSLFSNVHSRNLAYDEHQAVSNDGSIKTVHYYHRTQIAVDINGPFWPTEFPIKHALPSFLSARTNEKSTSSEERQPLVGKASQQTFDHQPALQKYTDVLTHSVLVYDMDKSLAHPVKINDSELMCPSLMFESRFEGGNLRQAKRV